MFCPFNTLRTDFEPQNYIDGNGDFSAIKFWRQEEPEIYWKSTEDKKK
jgi:hypothetical protein